jgi:hypothetical protein
MQNAPAPRAIPAIVEADILESFRILTITFPLPGGSFSRFVARGSLSEDTGLEVVALESSKLGADVDGKELVGRLEKVVVGEIVMTPAAGEVVVVLLPGCLVESSADSVGGEVSNSGFFVVDGSEGATELATSFAGGLVGMNDSGRRVYPGDGDGDGVAEVSSVQAVLHSVPAGRHIVIIVNKYKIIQVFHRRLQKRTNVGLQLNAAKERQKVATDVVNGH